MHVFVNAEVHNNAIQLLPTIAIYLNPYESAMVHYALKMKNHTYQLDEIIEFLKNNPLQIIDDGKITKLFVKSLEKETLSHGANYLYCKMHHFTILLGYVVYQPSIISSLISSILQG